MAEVNKRQAFVIQGADISPTIAAPLPDSGSKSRRRRHAAARTAARLKSMFERHCIPRLARICPNR
jgi:hypothetical protein